MLSMYRVFVF